MKTVTLALFILFSTTSIASAKEVTTPIGDAAKGKEKSMLCAACHGADGNSTAPNYPKIAGQHSGYLVSQLQGFKNGQRNDPSMAPMAAPLSEQDILDVSAYFASQTASQGSANEDLVAAGEKIYRGGNMDTGLPACTACHGPQGNGNAPAHYPTLSGQHAQYTKKQLVDFKAEKRGSDTNPNSVIMRQVAKKMTEEEMAAVAEYIAGLH